MALFLVFLAVSLLCFLPLSLLVFQLSLGASLLLTLLGFLLLHVLYVLFFGLVSCSISMDKPLEKQNPLCRFACYATASLWNRGYYSPYYYGSPYYAAPVYTAPAVQTVVAPTVVAPAVQTVVAPATYTAPVVYRSW